MHRHIYSSLAIALLSFSMLACGADQTDQANKLVGEMNELVVKGESLAKQGAAKEDEIQSKDVEKERDQIRPLALEQAAFYKQGAESLRAAAARADEAGKLILPDWFKSYLLLKAQQHRKGAEILDAAIERAELIAGDQPYDHLDATVSQVEERMAKLSREEDELTKQAAKIEAEHKADFNQ
jgi:hypothetical protein